MAAALDEVEFLGGIGIGAVFGGEHFAAVVPAEAVGIAEAAGEDLDRGFLGAGIEAPDRGGEGCLAAAGEFALGVGKATVGAGAVADVEVAVGTEGDVFDGVDEGGAAVVVRLKPRARFGREAVGGRGGGAVDRDEVLGGEGGGVLLVGGDVEAAVGPEGHREDEERGAEVAGAVLKVVFGDEVVADGAGGEVEVPDVASFGEDEEGTARAVAGEANAFLREAGDFAKGEAGGRGRERRVVHREDLRLEGGVGGFGADCAHGGGEDEAAGVAPRVENIGKDVGERGVVE
jgi:hypothetical protein